MKYLLLILSFILCSGFTLPQNYEYRTLTNEEFRSNNRKHIAKVNRMAWYELNQKTKYYIPQDKNWSPIPFKQNFLASERFILYISLKEFACGIYDNGDLIDWSNLLAGKSTPRGMFIPLKFDKEHESGLYKTPDGRRSPMPFAIQFLGNYFIHAGDVIAPQHLSHGCVNIPSYFMEWVFYLAQDNKNNFKIIIE